MKTIQQYFQEIDIDELVELYIYQHPLTFSTISEDIFKKSIFNEFQEYEQNIRELIETIQNVDVVENKETWIFFAYHVSNFDEDIDFALVKKSDLLDKEHITPSYAYEFDYIKDTAGYYVADTYLTQYNIKLLLISYLFESSFFGFKQEYLDEELTKLEMSTFYIEETLDIIEDEIKNKTEMKKLSDLDIYEPEKRDEEEYAAWKIYSEAEYLYNVTAFNIEEQKVIKLLEDADE